MLSDLTNSHAHQALLRESMLDPILSPVHAQLLLSYASLIYARSTPSTQRKNFVHEVSTTYHSSSAVWSRVFALESAIDESCERILQQIYERWRESDVEHAALAWGAWLLGHGRGKEAGDVIMGARGMLPEQERAALEKRWSEVLDGEGEEVDDGIVGEEGSVELDVDMS